MSTHLSSIQHACAKPVCSLYRFLNFSRLADRMSGDFSMSSSAVIHGSFLPEDTIFLWNIISYSQDHVVENTKLCEAYIIIKVVRYDETFHHTQPDATHM